MREQLLPLAVDLGSTRVRVAAVSRLPDGRLRLRGIGSATLDPDIDPGEALCCAVREAAVRQRRCLMMVRAAEAPLRWIRFPRMPGRERFRAASFEAQAALGTAGEPFVVRTRLLADGRTVLGAVTRAALERLTGAARFAGLRVERVEHEALVLASAEESTILDIGAHHATIALSRGGVPLVRVIERGGAAFTSALAQEFGIVTAKAEHRKQTIGLGGAAGNEVRAFVAALEAELRELRGTEGAQVPELRICGNGARLVDLSEAIAGELGIPIAAARMGRLVETGLPSAAERSGSLDWFGAVALAATGATR